MATWCSRGDTLSAIAARLGVSVDSLAAANGLDPSGLLISGTTLHAESVASVERRAGHAPRWSSTVAVERRRRAAHRARW